MALTKEDPKCQVCPFRDKCTKKRLCAEGVLERPPLAAATAESIAQPLMQDMSVKHDYREIKVAENTIITIDIEDMKKQLEHQLYDSISGGFLSSAN